MEKTDFILTNAKRINNFDLLTKVHDLENQNEIIWGEIKTIYDKAFWKTNRAEYEETIVEVVTDEGLTIYIPQRELSYHMPEKDSLVFMTGERVPVVVEVHVRIEGTLQEWDEVYYRPNSDYVLMGSIKSAEWILARNLEERWAPKKSPLRKELRGTVIDIYDPRFQSSRSHSNGFVKVDFDGVPVLIPAPAFSYAAASRVQKLEDQVRIGQEVYFKIFTIEKRPVTNQMRERHLRMGEEDTYWEILGEALYNKEEPHDAITRLINSGASSTQAYLISEKVSGYQVELVDAPGILLHMRPGGKGKYRPTKQMVAKHERIVVGLSDLKTTYKKMPEGYERYDGYVNYIPKR